MKKKKLLISGVVVLTLFFCGIYIFLSKPDGTTIESRKDLISKNMNGQIWNISTETEIDGYIISATYGDNQKSGIAIFKPTKNGKYKFQSHFWNDNDTIILTTLITEKNSYNLVWFNGALTSYAEITYTSNGQFLETKKFNTEGKPILYNISPKDEYEIKIRYYDENGTVYE